eukprot:TRINITY_DN31289_c0_g1_i1.p1 TRINITY_DN31289_c0_g1~~TRINITY_DN31289_c0_g1_i1.p1  ORF type:complete len:2032 (+),score=334.54 TRINITY_DN31289_c0_g1_i1:586-6096(+)
MARAAYAVQQDAATPGSFLSARESIQQSQSSLGVETARPPSAPDMETARRKSDVEARRKAAARKTAEAERRESEKRKQAEVLAEAERRREEKARQKELEVQRLQELRRKEREREEKRRQVEEEDKASDTSDDCARPSTSAMSVVDAEQSEQTPMPSDASSAGSDVDSDGSQEEPEGPCEPISVNLPPWYPDELPPPPGLHSQLSVQPSAPVVTCTGHGKVSVEWDLKNSRRLGVTWHVRARSTRQGSDWRKVDLDSGRIDDSHDEPMSWKHRAFVVQRGLKVLSFGVEEGQKSQRPMLGTIVSHFPGLVTVDFEPLRGIVVRQRVPQDWVMLASTSLQMKDVAWGMVEQQRQYGEGPAGRRLWRVARQKIYERIIRSHRQCAVIWSERVMLPKPGSRVMMMCIMGVPVDPSQDASPVSGEESPSSAEPAARDAVNTWWPGTLPIEEHAYLRSSEIDQPEDLSSRASINMRVDPYPRVQVIPRDWICEELPEWEKAKQHACPGQAILAYYAVSYDTTAGSNDVWGPHPEPRRMGDVTLLFGDAQLPEGHLDVSAAIGFGLSSCKPSTRSERAIRCTVRRELVSPMDAHVYVRCNGKKRPVRIPLGCVYSIKEPGASRRSFKKSKVKVLEWLVLRTASAAPTQVLARHGLTWEDAILLQSKVEVSFFPLVDASVASLTTHSAPSSRRLASGTIVRVAARTSHYEVEFQEVVPETHWTSGHSLGLHLLSDGNVHRIRNPQVVIHDVPDDMDEIEVSVGIAAAGGTAQISWSEPSEPCKVPQVSTPLAPLQPVLCVTSISRADVRWLLPQEPAALCFRIRLREVGKQDWCCLDSFGRARETDTAFAWRSRLIPLVEGIWASAFGDFDKRKASTPGAAKICSIVTDSAAVKVEFLQPSQEFSIGGLPPRALACTQCSQVSSILHSQDEQTIPIDWIEAVWVSDGSNYFKGAPLTSLTKQHEVILEEVVGGCQVLRDQTGTEPLQTVEDGSWLRWLHSQQADGGITLQLGAHEIVGLKPEVSYEVCVQALTRDGWTDWSMPGCVQMPRIGYEKELLVRERRATAFYKADLLPHAYYKEYGRCWDSMEESLTSDRLERLRTALRKSEAAEQTFDHKLSRWLVDMEGPIRESSQMPEAEARMLLRDLISRKANVNYRDQATGRMPLTCACEYGWKVKPGIIEELLNLQADVDSQNDSRVTALAVAASGGHPRIVEMLLRRGADATIVSLQGETALLGAKVSRGTHQHIQRVEQCRKLLCENREPWHHFAEQVRSAQDVAAAARAFLRLAFPEGPDTMFVGDKEGKRISKYDRLRLYEQIQEVAESGDQAEADQRGRLCAEQLLKQVEAAALQRDKECGYFARYLLFSGVMKWCRYGAKQLAHRLLDYYEKELGNMRSRLKTLPQLTAQADQQVGSRAKFAGRSLHQWHAHDDLPWLEECNVVGTFEALVHCGAIMDMEDFCSWVGELNAQIIASDGMQASTQLGAWDKRLPPYFWGSVYTKFLMGEAERAAPIFHDKAREIARMVGGEVTYRDAPNKQPGRVLKKQFDYASPGLTLLHEALDLMPGCFRTAYRADLPAPNAVQDVSDTDSPHRGAALILGRLGDQLSLAVEAVQVALSSPAVPTDGVLVLLLNGSFRSSSSAEPIGDEETAAEAVLLDAGAHAVCFYDARLEGSADARPLLKAGLLKLRAAAGLSVYGEDSDLDLEESERFINPYSEKSQVLFDIRKCKTGDTKDFFCTGGLLDLVRGSLTCSREEEAEAIFNLCLSLTVENDRAKVVRIKNGFHTPAVGGYADLKLFLMIAYDGDGTKVCHICELQVHLKQFLHKKKFTHMPYVIDRGDFDQH